MEFYRNLVRIGILAFCGNFSSNGQGLASHPDESPISIEESENEGRFREAITAGVDAIKKQGSFVIRGYIVGGTVNKRPLETFYVLFFVSEKDSEEIYAACYGYCIDAQEKELIIRKNVDCSRLFDVLSEELKELKFADRTMARKMGYIVRIYLIESVGPIHGIIHSPIMTLKPALLENIAARFFLASDLQGQSIEDLNAAVESIVSTFKNEGLHALEDSHSYGN